MGLFTIDRTINFDEGKVKKVLNIINNSGNDIEIENQMLAQGIVNLREGTDPHGFFRRRWATFLKDFELYNYPNITEIGKLYMNELLSTKEVTLLLLIKRTVEINNTIVRPFELILKTIEHLTANNLDSYISQEEFENILSHYLIEGYESLDLIVEKIKKRRNNDQTYIDVEMTEPCHYDIWKNFIISAEIGDPNSREIRINLELPIVKFIGKYFDDVTARKDKDFEFSDRFIKYIKFPSLVDENGEINFVRTNYKEYYPCIIYNYLFNMSINQIETVVLKANEHGNIPHKILNGMNISTNMEDSIRNIRLYAPFKGYEGIIINKLRNTTNKTYRYIADSISTYLLAGEIINEEEVEGMNDFDEYTKDNFLEDVFISEDKYDSIASILEKKKNIILEGAPGVGKTFMAKRLAYSIIGSKDTNKVKLIQFHQNYSYEDFIEGFRPIENGFELKKGLFYKLCKRAENDIDNNYYLIIDEINRGNLSKIFGELLMLIEADKRNEKLSLAYSEERFSVPNNLYIIGLMNTADRSLALIDYALRRRFSFIRIEPAFDNEKFIKAFNEKFDNDFTNVINIIEKINEAIEDDKSLGNGFKIGHSYFCPQLKDRKGNKKDIQDIITYEIIPLLEEYWYDDEDSLIQWKNALDGVLND